MIIIVIFILYAFMEKNMKFTTYWKIEVNAKSIEEATKSFKYLLKVMEFYNFNLIPDEDKHKHTWCEGEDFK